MSPKIIGLGLDALYYTALYRLIDRMIAGVGGIFCFHRVVDEDGPSGFAPTAGLAIRASFLNGVLDLARTEGWDIVTLSEVRRRLVERRFGRKFVCFTVDDIYRDTHEVVLPMFQRHGAPFTAFVTTGIPDRTLPIWWFGVEQVLNRCDDVWFGKGDRLCRLQTRTADEKTAAYALLVGSLKATGDPAGAFADFCALNDQSPESLSDELGVTWEELRAMQASGVVEFGAHTLTHPAIAALPEDEARREMGESRSILEDRLKVPVRHFAFPYGDPGSCGVRDFGIAGQLGFDTAVTTRKGVLVPGDAGALHALPRLVLNGHFQKERYAKVFMSGVLGSADGVIRWIR
ncbi:polysaccharide deacetylase family protein [Azospirillum sp. B506]|uniref:polysaccharide deacetylase family protein n=1 Tax=Azospirillum sp. B506 TaxID=137721 RepID=UPI000346D5A8|nr:polysaccharide deacetylase family protein [Azospirillum sp. B506]